MQQELAALIPEIDILQRTPGTSAYRVSSWSVSKISTRGVNVTPPRVLSGRDGSVTSFWGNALLSAME